MNPAAVVQDSALHKVASGHPSTVAASNERPMNPRETHEDGF